VSTWTTADADVYDARWRAMQAAGQSIHGEADLVCSLLDQLGRQTGSVLDAGCGTGRVAIELANRGHQVVGADLDDAMLTVARRHAPELAWVHSDLASLSLDRQFDVVALAGNVVGFVHREHRANSLRRCVEHTAIDGLIVAGFSLSFPGLTPAVFHSMMVSEGTDLVARFSTWSGDPFDETHDYLVSVYRRVDRPRRTNIHDVLALSRDCPSLTVDELTAQMAINEVVVLDTRTPSDRAARGHIPGAIHAPSSVLEWRVDPASGYQDPRIVDFDQHLVVVCNEGYSSSVAAASLRRLGFWRARDLHGGMGAWIAAGLPLDVEDPTSQLTVVSTCMANQPDS
jgi:rhodanese-related sulfurtransferase